LVVLNWARVTRWEEFALGLDPKVFPRDNP
jgi:hypothetical protein